MAWRLTSVMLLLSSFAVDAQAETAGPTDAFYSDPPQCVVVLAGPAKAGIAAGDRIAAALARQLSGRVAKVIHPLQRRRMERELAVDLDHPDDARHFAAAANCPAYLRWQVLDAGFDQTPVWSRKHLLIGAELIRAADGAILWRAQSAAARSSGDVPLSVFSLPLALVRSTTFQNDDDAVASLLDDLARRLLATLPDVR